MGIRYAGAGGAGSRARHAGQRVSLKKGTLWKSSFPMVATERLNASLPSSNGRGDRTQLSCHTTVHTPDTEQGHATTQCGAVPCMVPEWQRESEVLLRRRQQQ